MSELSPPYRQLLEVCASCGGPMPCALHDAALREAMLRPPEREGVPWEKVERRELGSCGMDPFALAQLHDGTILVVAFEGDILTLDPEEPSNVRRHGAYNGDVRAVLPLPDGSFIMGGLSSEVMRFDPAGLPGEQREVLAQLEGRMYALAALPDGGIICGFINGRIVRCDPARPEGERTKEIARFDGGITVTSLDVHPSGVVFASGSEGHYAKIEFPEPGVVRRTYMTDRSVIATSVQALTEDACLVFEIDGSIVRFDFKGIEAGEPVERVGNCRDVRPIVRRLPDGTFLIGERRSGRIVQFDLERPAESRMEEVTNFGSDIRALTPTSDHAFLVGGSDGSIVEYAIPERAMTAWRERKLDQPDIPPMPEA